MNIETFARRILRRPLWPHQVEAANSGRFVTTVAKARRTGGTALAEALAIHTAFSNRACKVLVLSATQDAARRVTESIAATLARNPETRGAVVDDFATRIRLSNGSQIISLPASQRQVRGYGEGVLLVILDEASFMASEMWTAAHYTALDERANGSRIVMLGTPFGSTDHFFRRAFLAGKEGDPDHSAHHWTYEVNPRLDREYLERQRDRVSPAEWHAEVLGEWSEAVGQLIPDATIEAQTLPVEVPDLAELARIPARPVAGLDTGVSFDRSALGLIYRLPGLAALNPEMEERPRLLFIPHAWKAGERFSAVVEDAHRVPAIIWSVEVNGAGAGMAQQLQERVRTLPKVKRRWNFVATTAAKKTAGYGCLLGLAERGLLFWLSDPDFLRQLRGLRFEQGERGFTHIEAEDSAVHDDITDAAMLATVPMTGKGRVVCHLSRLADPRRAAPDADPQLAPDDLVESGGGVRAWLRPPLQSATGRGFWVPPGLRRQRTGDVVRLEGPLYSPQVERARRLIHEGKETQ